MGDLIQLKPKLLKAVKSRDTFPIDFDEAWKWVGYSSKQKAKDMLERNFIENTNFNRKVEVRLQQEGKRKVNRPYEKITLTIDCFKEFCMLSETSKGAEVREYYLDIEKEYFEIKKSGDYLETRKKSKAVRNAFTGILNDHGVKEPLEYMKITSSMKSKLGIKAKKDDMNIKELIKINMAESLSSLRIIEENPEGYSEVKPICSESSSDIKELTEKRKVIGF